MRSVPATLTHGSSHASIVLLLAVALGAAVFYPQFSLSHDASWYITATSMFLDGSHLYEDIIEINPPLAFYLTSPPIMVARLLEGNPTTSYFVYVCVLCFISCLGTLKVLNTSVLKQIERNTLLVFVTVALFVLPIAEFGQREHLMLAFALPFLLGLILRPTMPEISVSYQIVLALAASLGLLLKPYFLLIPASIAITRLWQERSLRPLLDPGLLALAGTTITYVVFVLLVHPAYLEFIVPVARDVYAAYGVGAEQVLLKPELIALVLAAISAQLVARGVSEPVTQLFASASIGAATNYLIQFKGWNYHILPLSAFLLLSAAWLCLRNCQAFRRDMIQVVSLTLIALMTVGHQVARGPYRSATTEAFKPFVKTKDESILVLSTNVWAAFPFVNEVSGSWASRFPAQWFIPGAHNRLQSTNCAGNAANCEKAFEIIGLARTAIIEDLIKFEPDLVFVDERSNKSYFGSHEFDYIDFLSEDPRFHFFRKCYTRIESPKGYGVFVRSCTCIPLASSPR